MKDEVVRYTESMTSSLLKKYTAQDDPEIEQVKEVTKTLINQYICASVEPLKRLEVSSYEYLLRIILTALEVEPWQVLGVATCPGYQSYD